MKGELYRLFIICLLSIFLVFCILKFLYIDMYEPNFWPFFLDYWLESLGCGAIYM